MVKPMKVVMAPVNIAGQPILLVKELRRLGLDISLVQYTGREGGHRLGYESDRIVRYTGVDRDNEQFNTIETLLREGTTIFHFWLRSLFFSGVYEGFTGFDIPIIRSYGRNIVYRFTGEDLRIRSLHMARNPHNAYQYGYRTQIDEDRQRRYIDFLKENVDRFIVQDPEMHEFCPEAVIVPRVVDLSEFPYVGSDGSAVPLVVHAPTSPLVKGSGFVRNAVAELQSEGLSFKYEEISGLAHEEASQRYRQADIIIDQLHIGWYGVLAIEGMALGKAVISYIRPEFLESHQPKIPIIPANPLTIKEVLRAVVRDAERRREVGQQGRLYVEAVHDVQKVAPRLLAIYGDLPEKELRQPAAFATLDYFRDQWRHERERNAGFVRRARAYDRLRSGRGEFPAAHIRARGSARSGLTAADSPQDLASLFVAGEPLLEFEEAETVPVSPKLEPNETALGEVSGVRVLRCPWPYNGMLAICSDIDRTTASNFAALHRFLNTREKTPLGQGLGLDIADSFWFYASQDATRDPSDQQLAFFSGLDWRQRSPQAEQILDYIRGGWIDTLHSYGDFSIRQSGYSRFSRAHAERALAVLAEADLTITIWVNHGSGNNIQNIGAAETWVGDVPGSPEYHADLLFRHGMRFLYPGEISAQFRRETAASPITLRDGRNGWRFSRQDFAYRDDARDLAESRGAVTGSHAGKAFAMVWEPKFLDVQLSSDNLAELVAEGGYAILGQHFGATAPGELLPKEAIAALERLKAAQDDGDILVARTSRLLEYASMREYVRFTVTQDASGTTQIDITGIDDPVRGLQPPVLNRLRGVTFEVPGKGPVELSFGGRPISVRIPREIVRAELEKTRIIGIKWFASDHSDHVRSQHDSVAVGGIAEETQTARGPRGRWFPRSRG